MNRHCYRIVFNKARGMLMVVSEAARSCNKASGQTNPTKNKAHSQTGHHSPHHDVSSGHRLTALALSALLINTPLLQYAHASDSQIVADKQAGITQQPTLLKAKNGTPIIDIRAASIGGVSRNIYSQMDIGDNGAILNNSRFGANTHLAGDIDGNFWLLFGEAHTIVNEVNATNPMQFNGTLEVAGNTANVIIASPSGITVNGGNLINAQTGTLTTGTVNYDRLGNPTGVQVTQGTIRIGEQGMHNAFASGVSITNLLANSVAINGQITGNTQDLVQVVVGQNDVALNKNTYTITDVAPHAPTTASPNKATTAIDIGQAGGIYANGIRLIGTEAGMGVTNAGTLKAHSFIDLTNNGTIRNAGQMVVGDANSVNARLRLDNHEQSNADIINTGQLQAGNRVDIHAGRDLTGDGSITRNSTHNIHPHIDALNITAQRDWQVGSLNNTNPAGDIQLVAGRNLSIDQSATLTTKDNVLISAGNDLSLNQTDIQSTGDDKVVGIYSGQNLSLKDTAIHASGTDSVIVNHAGQHQTLANVDLKADRIRQNTPGQLTLNQAKLVSTGQDSDIKLIAGTGITAKQLEVVAQDGAIVLEAAKASLLDTPTSDIALEGAHLYATKTIDIVAEDDVTVQKAKLNGQQIRSTAGGNLTLGTLGASTAEQNVYLKAGETLSLSTAGSLSGNHIEALASRIELADNTKLTAKTGDIKLSATSQNPERDASLANDINLGAGSNLQANKNLAISTNNGHIQASDLTANADSLGMIATDGIELDSQSSNTNNTLTARTGNLTLLNQGDHDVKLTDVTANAKQGQLTLSTAGDIQLNTRHSATNQIHAERVRIGNREAEDQEQRTDSNINISNTNVTANASDMVIDSDAALTLANSNLTAKGNLELHGDDTVYLENVDTDSQKHTAVSSDTTLSIASSNLTSEGVLSTKSQGDTNLKDTTFTAGALLHHAEEGKLDLGDNVNFNAQHSDLLANNPELAAINGSMTLKGAGDLTLDAGHHISTDGQIDLNTKGTLTLKGDGGNTGNGSQTNVQLQAKEDIYLTGGHVILQGSDITSTAGGIQATATVGDIELQAIKNDIDGVKPENRIAELNDTLATINRHITTLNQDSVYQTALTAKQTAQTKLDDLIAEHQQTPIADFDGQKQQLEADIATAVNTMNVRVAELDINKTHDELAQDKADTERSLDIANTPYQGTEHYGTHLTAKEDIKLLSVGGIAIDAGDIDTRGQFIAQSLGQQATGRTIIDEEIRAALTIPLYTVDKLTDSDKQALLNEQLALVDGMTFSLDPTVNQNEDYTKIRNQLKAALPDAIAGDADAQKTVSDLLASAPPVKHIPVAISIEGLHDIYQRGKEGDDIFSLHNNHRASNITADKGITLQATGADNTDPSTVTTTGAPNSILLGSGDFIAKDGDINISTVGNLVMQAGQDSIYDEQTKTKKKKSWGGLKKKVTVTTTTEDIRSADPVTLVANNIQLNAADSIYGYATEFKAPEGNTIIQAGDAIRLMAVEEVDNKTVDTKKTSSFIGFKYNKDRSTRTRNIASELPSSIAANIVNTQSGDDTQLQGTQFEYLTGADLKAGVGMKAVDDASIIFETINTTVYERQTNEFNNVVWQSMSDSGSISESAELPTFTGPVSPTFSAPGGLIVQVPLTEEQQQDSTNLVNVIDRMSQQQGYGYLQDITKRDDVDFSVIRLAQEEWNYEQEGLTPAGAALLALAVTAATGGAGAGIVGATESTIWASVANAGFTSLATQASITLVNNKGDIRQTLDDLATDETARAVLTAALTAGALEYVNSSVMPGVFDRLSIEDAKSLQGRLVNGAFEGTTSALVDTAINGGSLSDNLETALLNSSVNAAHGFAAGEIAYRFTDDFTRIAVQAGAACAAAQLTNSDCESGAIGVAIGELVAEQMKGGRLSNDLSPEKQENILLVSKLLAGTVAAYAGYNAQTAIDKADIAVQNNALGDDLEKLGKQVLGGLAGSAVSLGSFGEIFIDSEVREEAIEGLKILADSDEPLTLVKLGLIAQNQEFQELDALMAMNGDDFGRAMVDAKYATDVALMLAGVASLPKTVISTANAVGKTAALAVNGTRVIIKDGKVIVAATALQLAEYRAIQASNIVHTISTNGTYGKNLTLFNTTSSGGRVTTSIAGRTTITQNGKVIQTIAHAPLEVKATEQVLKTIDNFSSNTQAGQYAAVIGAYDPLTGRVAIGKSNPTISRADLHPDTIRLVEQRLGAKIGDSPTPFCSNAAGACAEVAAADALIRQGVKPDHIQFTKAYRPRVVRTKGVDDIDAIVPTCKNCSITFPNAN